MTKFCSNCGKELNDNNAFCLNCGVMVGNNNQTTKNNTKTKRTGLPTWAIVLIVVGSVILLPIIMLVLIGIFVYNAAENPSTFIEEIMESGFGTQTGTIGDTLIAEDFEITLTSALIYDSVGDSKYRIETPKEGKEFLVLFFEIENITRENQYISSYDFNGYIDGYTISPKTFLNQTINDTNELSATLAPGKRTKGYIAYEVDKTWQEVEICFDDWYNDSQLIFKVINENSLQGA